MRIEQVAICGMGALGMLSVNDVPCYFPMRDGAEDVSADLVIVAVKYTGLIRWPRGRMR